MWECNKVLLLSLFRRPWGEKPSVSTGPLGRFSKAFCFSSEVLGFGFLPHKNRKPKDPKPRKLYILACLFEEEENHFEI